MKKEMKRTGMTNKKKAEDAKKKKSDAEKDIMAEDGQEEVSPPSEEQSAEAEGAASDSREAPETDGGDPEDEAAAGSEPEESADARYTRLYAEFQNYKKRTQGEGFERYLDGKKDLASGIIDVLDNFERAILSDASAGVEPGFVEGMDMIRKQLIDVLARNGIEEIEALGEDFDPNFHQGVGTESTDEYESGKVSLVLQKGYALKEKIIRPSMVKIAE